MPGSSPQFKLDIKTHIIKLYPEKNASVLDVGAGCGTYSDLLIDCVGSLHAIEVHTPYIDQFNLTQKYDVVFPVDCRDFDFSHQFYDVIIFGDCIEHLNIDDAVKVLRRAIKSCRTLIVSVPFMTRQGAVADVSWEIHLQPDLNKDTMRLRYPMLKLWLADDKIGVYLGIPQI